MTPFWPIISFWINWAVKIWMRTDQFRTRVENLSVSLYLRNNTFSSHWRLRAVFPQLELGHQRHFNGPKQSRQRRPEQCCLAVKRGLAPGPPHDCDDPQPCYFIIEFNTLESSQAVLSITIELFALNKDFFFTAPQTGDSYWSWIGTNDHQWTFLKETCLL